MLTISIANNARGARTRALAAVHLPTEDPVDPQDPHKPPPPQPGDEPPPIPEGDPPSDSPPERAV